MGLGRSELLFTVYHAKDLPLQQAPRWAVVGRSNVGKSTLLNSLVHPQKHFRTGSKPGVTRGLIGVKVYLGKSEKSVLELIDLPGFGFALGADQDSKRWAELADAVRDRSPGARLWLWLVDSHRDPLPEDQQFFQWLDGEPFILLFTKSDRDKPKQRAQLERKWKEFMLYSVEKPLWISAEKNENLDQLEKLAKNFLRQSHDEKAAT